MSWAAYELNKDWHKDGHPHERDENGFCTTCGARKGEGHYKCGPKEAEPVRPSHQCEPWQIQQGNGGDYCAACGKPHP